MSEPSDNETIKALRAELQNYRRPRYRAGFEKGARCGWTDVFPPGTVPVVDRRSAFVFGDAVAFAVDKKTAQRIADALNMIEGVDRAMGDGSIE